MAEPLKNLYTPAYITQVGNAVNTLYPAFNNKAFSQWVLADDWPKLELKGRMHKISQGLQKFLALPYTAALEILMPVSTQFGGGDQGDYLSMFFPDFVEHYGLDDFEASMQALAHFTQYSSSEFAVRPFIVKYGDKMMQQMQQWANSSNVFIRRLASEGCRPRLPWAMALPAFKKDPSAIMPILNTLKADESLFVRRSVANNLNDIAKDHPQLIVDTAKQWLGQHDDTDWLIKHACRSLLKQSHSGALALFGFLPPDHVRIDTIRISKSVTIGQNLDIHFSLSSPQKLGKLRLEYIIDFVKANGKTSPKVFQISESTLALTNKTYSKSHSFKPISTRRYYTGQHGISIIINGQRMTSDHFELKPA